MTGERMETVREALRSEEYPGTRARYVAVQAALAEVARWEHDRARLTAALRQIAAGSWNFGNRVPGLTVMEFARAALGEGQDSDRPTHLRIGGVLIPITPEIAPLVGECPCEGGDGCVC